MSLWTSEDIAAATGGIVSAPFAVDGVAFDSREVGAGDLFIALKGEHSDGHRYIAGAIASGASGLLVSEPVDHPHVRVADTTVALDALGSAARARTAGHVIGVTGSVGKTGTKEALWAALDRIAPGRAHRSVKSYNNHTGVPLSLARMPAGSRYAVFEMGMNHAGELAQLTRLVRPHVALVTAIAPAHAAYFRDEAAIADAKGEIFQGLEPGGTAVIPFDSPHRDRLIAAATPHATHILTFGRGAGADVRVLEEVAVGGRGTHMSVALPGGDLTFTLGQPGAHWVSNALAVLAVVHAVGGDLPAAGLALAELEGLPGRGRRFSTSLGDGEVLVIDEAYNANPASMAATIGLLGTEKGRRIVLLGEMRELGDKGPDYHAALAGPLAEAGVAAAILVGPGMEPLASRLEGQLELRHVPDAAAARESLEAMLAPGDVLLIKGSNAIGLGAIVEALASERFASGTQPCSI